MHTTRRSAVTVITALALTLGLLGAVTATAGTASAASKVTLKPLKTKVRLQVMVSKGAVLYGRDGKVLRDRAKKPRRLARGTVRTYTHRARIKGREYRRMAGKGYLVRFSSLRVHPRPVAKPVLAIQGDSITSQYNDRVGDPMRGWWSFLSQAKGATVRIDAIGGTGFAKRAAANGVGCVSPNFRERLAKVATMKPDTLVVQGGRNDWWDCGVGALTPEQIDANVAAYFADLQRTVAVAGIDHVYVTTVWGPGDAARRGPVIAAVSKHAQAAGYRFTFIDLAQSETRDGTHPNAAGSQRIYRTLAPIVKIALGR